VVAHQLGEADQRLARKGAEKHAALEKRRVFAPDRVQVLSVVPESPSLADWAFVVDAADAEDERVIEGDLPDGQTLFGPPHHVARFSVDLLRPPAIERGDRQRRHVVPLERKVVPRRDVGETLGKGKEVDSCPGAPDGLKGGAGIAQEVVLFRREAGDADEPSPDLNVLAEDLHRPTVAPPRRRAMNMEGGTNDASPI